MKLLLTSASFILLTALGCGAESDHATPKTSPIARGDVFQNASGTKLRILMGDAEFGGNEIEMGEITFVPNSDSGEHVHGATETFYVLQGELEHVVNGKSVKLTVGMVGTVRPPDKVRHKTGPSGAKALVIWAPAGEAARIAGRWKRVEP